MFYSNFVPKTYCATNLIKWYSNNELRYSTCNYTVTLKPGLGSLKVIGTDTYRSATCDFLLTFHNNHGPISYRFRDRRRFQSKIANIFPPPCILRLWWRVSPGIGHRRWASNTRMMGLLGRERFDDIFSRLDTIHQRDGRTEGHRATAKTALTHSVARYNKRK